MRRRLYIYAVLLYCLVACGFAAAADKPALVVFISVDQLRGDLPLGMMDRFGPDGFRRFYDRGTWYTNAHYGHVTTYTGSGHATLATGGNPREHGIIGNEWYDRKTGKLVYCVSDESFPLIGAPTGGASPKNLLAPTLGDALVDATRGVSRVFAVSGKDRAAVLMAGKKGKAFWYNGATGNFVTSRYYYDAMPAWVEDFNDPIPANQYRLAVWSLVRPEASYQNADSRPVELPHELIGGQFPHWLGGLLPAQLYPTLSVTPFSDELVFAFARTLIDQEQLGQRGATDALMMSLSSTDIIGHQFGPESREQEDNLLRLDAGLQNFFQYLDAHVGPDRVVIALSADHGVDGNPGGKPSGFVDEEAMREHVDAALKAKFGDGKYVLGYKEPCLYFTPETTAAHAADLNALQDAAAESLVGYEGIAYSIPAHRVEAGELDASDPILEATKRSFRKGLSGDVFVMQKPYFRFSRGKPTYTATHGSPYEYDQHVPVCFVGPGVAAQRLDTAIGPESIAATLAAIMGVPAPSGATGPALALGK